MNGTDQETLRRTALLGARIRFSPTGASVRNQAIERIIEQNLAIAEAAKGLLEQQLRELTSPGGQIAILRAQDVRQGIDSLTRSGRIVVGGPPGERRYRLSQEAKKDVEQIIAESEARTDATVQALFGNAPGGAQAYRNAFLQLLCLVFSRLSELYVRVITMKHAGEGLAGHRLLTRGIDEVLQVAHVADENAFRYGVNRFFRESSPQFDHIKWNMAQNFYVAQALGIDTAADVLSADIFGGASLYCDTNVLISGLMPESRYHQSFRELVRTCNTLDIGLKVVHATVEELRGVIHHYGALLRKVFDSIPEEMQSKVRSFLLDAFLAEREKSPGLSVDDFLERFQKPLDALRDSFGLTEEDDRWFDAALEDQSTKTLATALSKQYEEMRNRPKSETAALHDAVLLRWVARENAEGRQSWVVTADLTVVEWNARTKESRVLTPDALLQWVTPVALGAADEDRLAGVFAEAIRYQLLPRETFFQLSDFQVFAEMGIETQQLPAADVEACIQEIRQAGPHLDPSKAEDREKIGQVIQRYFADPGTKYRRRIDELQAQSAALGKELETERRLRTSAENRVAELKIQSEQMTKQIQNGQNALADGNSRIERLELLMQEQQKATRHKRLVNSLIRRTFLAVGLLAAIELVIGYLVWRYGEGPNLFQKLTNAWPLLAAGSGVVVIAYPFLVGRERIRLLKWWKGEAD
jgi:hypothetical protein